MLPGNSQIPQAVPPVLALIISEMTTAGVRVTPLGIVAAMTDRGAADDEVVAAVDLLIGAGVLGTEA